MTWVELQYPLKFAAKVARNTERRRWRRLTGSVRIFERREKKYGNVTIMRGRKDDSKNGWWLAYNGEPTTGCFPTLQECIAWYARGGL